MFFQTPSNVKEGTLKNALEDFTFLHNNDKQQKP
jgi:hypothetical protein